MWKRLIAMKNMPFSKPNYENSAYTNGNLRQFVLFVDKKWFLTKKPYTFAVKTDTYVRN